MLLLGDFHTSAILPLPFAKITFRLLFPLGFPYGFSLNMLLFRDQWDNYGHDSFILGVGVILQE